MKYVTQFLNLNWFFFCLQWFRWGWITYPSWPDKPPRVQLLTKLVTNQTKGRKYLGHSSDLCQRNRGLGHSY